MDHEMPMPMPSHDHGHGNNMQCSMSMVWNTSTRGICVVFSSWQIRGLQSLAFTLIALFLLAMTLEYLRLSIRSYDAHLLSTYNLSSNVLSALNATSSHRRKASIQQRRTLSTTGGALLSSSLKPTLGERRSVTSDSTTSSWAASDDDAPLLPTSNDSRRQKRSLKERFRITFLSSLPFPRRVQLRRTILYVASVALGMFLMLVFMTYNAWLITAILAGAGFGHYLFGRDLGLGRLGDEKGMACH